MSLFVCVQNPDKESEDISPHPDLGSGLFGFEFTRTTLWGHPVMTELGLSIIPSLRSQDIFVTGMELQKLNQELLIISSSISRIVNETGCEADFIRFRCANAERHVAWALEHSVAVAIG